MTQKAMWKDGPDSIVHWEEEKYESWLQVRQ